MNSRTSKDACEAALAGLEMSARAKSDKDTGRKSSSGDARKKAKKAVTKKTSKKPTGKTSATKKAKRVVKKSATKKKTATKKTVTKKVASRRAAAVSSLKDATKRRNPRLVQNILALRGIEQEDYFNDIGSDELVRLFEDSYPSDLVNLFLGIKPSTCRRVFEVAINRRKKAYLDIITLYYHRSYLVNPFPLDLRAIDGEQIPNYYAILGVSKDATGGEIEVAAKLLLKAYQAGSFAPSDRKLGDQRREEIKDSFSNLKTSERRHVTDRRLPAINYYYPRRDQSWMELVQRFMP